MKKLLTKRLALFLGLWLGGGFFLARVIAEDATPSGQPADASPTPTLEIQAEPTPTGATPTETPFPEPTATVTPEPAFDPLPTAVPSEPTPTLTIDAPTATPSATLAPSPEASSSAEATSSAEASPSTSLADDEATFSATLSAALTNSGAPPTAVPAATAQQSAGTSSTTSADANTGSNQSVSGETTMTTGEATASAQATNVENLFAQGDHFQIVFVDLDKDDGDLDLNDLWCQLESLSAADATVSADPVISLDQSALLDNQVAAQATTGQNLAVGDVVLLKTGDAFAQASVVNVVNTVLGGQKYIFSIVNIFDNWEGDIILPGINSWLRDGREAWEFPWFQVLDQEAVVQTLTAAQADTGHNAIVASSNQLTTGDAQADSRAVNLVNQIRQEREWLTAIVNNLGSWEGEVKYNSFLDNFFAPLSPSGFSPEMTVSQRAVVSNEVTALASTGDNQILASASTVETGDATAWAKAVNLVNTVFSGQRWFYSLINVFGSWKGNLVFAYPDLQVVLSADRSAVSPGEELTYRLDFENIGLDFAADAQIEVPLPAGLSFISQDSGFAFSQNGNHLLWSLGQVEKNASGQINFRVLVAPDFSFDEELSFWQKLVPKATAAQETAEKEISLRASISTSEAEEIGDNNQAIVTTRIFRSSTADSSSGSGQNATGGSAAAPDLDLKVKNNVAEFVYPGDVVTFEAEIINRGSGPAKEVVLFQELLSGPYSLGVARFSLGELLPGEKVKVTFGWQLSTGFRGGRYQTIAQASGYATDGQEHFSPEQTTSFLVKVKNGFVAAAADGNSPSPEVLGVKQAEVCSPLESWLPYLFSLLTASLWLSRKAKEKIALLKSYSAPSAKNANTGQSDFKTRLIAFFDWSLFIGVLFVFAFSAYKLLALNGIL